MFRCFAKKDFKHIATCNRIEGRGGGIAILSREQNLFKFMKCTDSKRIQFHAVSTICNKQCLTAVHKLPGANKDNFLEDLLNHMAELKTDA